MREGINPLTVSEVVLLERGYSALKMEHLSGFLFECVSKSSDLDLRTLYFGSVGVPDHPDTKLKLLWSKSGLVPSDSFGIELSTQEELISSVFIFEFKFD